MAGKGGLKITDLWDGGNGINKLVGQRREL